MPTLGQPEVFLLAKDELFDAAGGIGPASQKFLQKWMDRYAALVKKHAA
jgi:chromate reductase